ncbi:hypothetical protein ACLKA6_000691 [Drosophila palustris]
MPLDANPFARRPRIQSSPSAATCPLPRNEIECTGTSDSETPKRPRDPDSPSSKPRKTPPKKTRSGIMEIDEMGSILEELIYTYSEKQPVTRHVNLATKSMLHRLRELHGSVRAQLTETSSKLDDALSQIDLLQQPSAEEQQATKERILEARPSCNATTQTTESKAYTEVCEPSNLEVPKALQRPSAKPGRSKASRTQNPSSSATSSKKPQPKDPPVKNPTVRVEDHHTKTWTEVKRQKPKLKPKSRPDAIIVKCTEKTPYADVVKMMNAEPSLQDLKGNVQGIRKSATGELILRMQKRDDPATDQLQSALRKMLSDKALVKTVHDTVMIEVHNIDETLTADELLVALFASIEGDIPAEVVPSMRKTYRGKQIATLVLQPSLATKLLTLQKTHAPISRIGYKTDSLNTGRFLSAIHLPRMSSDANTSADAIAEAIIRACDASMAKVRKGSNPYRPVAWWNDAIANARRECHAARRQCQRHRNSPDYESLAQIFRLKRKKFKNAIKLSKARHFQELCEAADSQPYGSAYKMVMGRLARQPMPSCSAQLGRIIGTLFPSQPQLILPQHQPQLDEPEPALTNIDEVLNLASKIKTSKAVGPDGIPNAAIKMAIAAKPGVFVELYNKCIVEGTVPRRWKLQRLVLIPKAGKDLDDPSSYRPLCFADDIAVVTTGKKLEDTSARCSSAIDVVISWLSQNGLALAEHKSEAVLMSSRKLVEKAVVRVGYTHIESKPAIKYLGVMLDHRLSFKHHLEYVSARASTVTTALSRMMANTRGPKERSRKLIAGVVTSTILYASAIWAPAMEVASYSRGCKSAYRRCALRVSTCFRTVSETASLVVARMVPLHLLAAERQSGGSTNRIVRDATISQWQISWDSAPNGRWTYRLIKELRPWLRRRHGQLNFYLSQLLTGHGCFKSYLHRFKHAEDPFCDHCGHGIIEDAEHSIFLCPLFGRERGMSAIGRLHLTPDNLVAHMLAEESTWTDISNLAAHIMKDLRRRERLRNGATN